MPNHYKFWKADEKYEIIEPILKGDISIADQSRLSNISSGQIANWIRAFKEKGKNGLKNKNKPGNPLIKYTAKKELTELEEKDYEILKLKIENERLKKGYLVKGDGTVQISTKLKQKSSK